VPNFWRYTIQKMKRWTLRTWLKFGCMLMLLELIGGFNVTESAAAGTLTCTVRLSTGRPSAGDIITMLVTTSPGAKVSGTSAQYPSGYSWEMQPTEPANASGHAWLFQKISVPTRSGTVTVTVHLLLDGNYGSCRARYRVVAQ
jgi:hypothetical protein